MKTLYKIIPIILFAIFNSACGPSTEEKAAMEKAEMDSVAAVTKQQEDKSQKPEAFNDRKLFIPMRKKN